MSVTIERAPDHEAGLAALARAQGLGLTQYVQLVLKAQIPSETAGLTPAERASAWLASTDGLPPIRPLPDEAISRESLYGSRG